MKVVGVAFNIIYITNSFPEQRQSESSTSLIYWMLRALSSLNLVIASWKARLAPIFSRAHGVALLGKVNSEHINSIPTDLIHSSI